MLVRCIEQNSASPAKSRRRRAGASANRRRLALALVGAILLTRLVLSLLMLSRPGLEMDEVLFVNAATLRIPGFFLSYSFHGLPILNFPYIGALKAWLYTPLFALFGSSPATIRIPVVVLVTAGLGLLYVGVRDLVNRPVALLALAVLSFDNSILWLSRNDIGPSAIEFFLKCAGLFCAARFAHRRTKRWLLWILLVMALGIFNKINFIWTVNAVTAVGLLVAGYHRRSLRAHWSILAFWLAGLAAIYAGFAWYYFGQRIGIVAPGAPGEIMQPWHGFSSGTLAVLAGTWFYDYLYAPLATPAAFVVIFLALFAAGSIGAAVLRGSRNIAVAGLSVAAVLTAVQVLLTVQATAGWHYMAVYPFPQIVAAYGAYALASFALSRRRHLYVALACVGVLALGYDGALIATYYRAMASKEPVYPWTEAIYRLNDEVQRSRASVFTVDWGIANPLFALHPNRRIFELEFELQSPQPGTFAAITHLVATTPGPKLFITHPLGKTAFANVNRNLFAAIGARHLRVEKAVLGLDHKPVFVVYAYR